MGLSDLTAARPASPPGGPDRGRGSHTPRYMYHPARRSQTGCGGKKNSSRCDAAQRLLGLPLSKGGCSLPNELVIADAASSNIRGGLLQQLSPHLHCIRFPVICQLLYIVVRRYVPHTGSMTPKSVSPVCRTATTPSQFAAQLHASRRDAGSVARSQGRRLRHGPEPESPRPQPRKPPPPGGSEAKTPPPRR